MKVNNVIDYLTEQLQLANSDDKENNASINQVTCQHEGIIHFEFSLPSEYVRMYERRMNSKLRTDENIAKFWFNGTLDKRSGKVISATTGRAPQEEQEAVTTVGVYENNNRRND